MGVIIHQATVIPGGGISLMARIRKWDTSYIRIADISQIDYDVYDMADGTLGINGTLAAADVVFDTLQIDPAWDADAIGYNFKWDAPETITPSSNKVYQAQVIITLSSGADIAIPPWELTTTNIIGK